MARKRKWASDCRQKYHVKTSAECHGVAVSKSDVSLAMEEGELCNVIMTW